MNDFRKGIAAAALGDVEDCGPDAASRRYLFGEDFVGFSGHFPGDPVLPAVAQLRTVVSLAEECAGRPLRLAEIRSAKFLFPILPGKEVLVRYRRSAGDDGDLYDATLSIEGKKAASFLLRLADAGDRR